MMYRKHGLNRVGKSEKQKLVHKLDSTLAMLIKIRDDGEPGITCPKIQEPGDDPRGAGGPAS